MCHLFSRLSSMAVKYYKEDIHKVFNVFARDLNGEERAFVVKNYRLMFETALAAREAPEELKKYAEKEY